jgi:hypothetical protein
MLNHYARIVQPSLALEAARAADDGFTRALAAATFSDPERLRRGLPTRSLEQVLNVQSNGGSGCSSVADNLDASYLASIADTMGYYAAFASTAPLIAATFADPTTWTRCSMPTFGSAASAWDAVTACYTFHDLALCSGMDKSVYS